MQIVGEPIDTVEGKVLTSQTHTNKLCSVILDQRFFLLTRILEISVGFLYISLCNGWIRCHLLIKLFIG